MYWFIYIGPPLYAGWKSRIPKEDHEWISKRFFRRNPKGIEFRHDMVDKLWYHPPHPSLSTSIRNSVDRYFGHRLFLWMPLNVWALRLNCPYVSPDTGPCDGTMRRSSVHQKTRMVLDIDSYYFIASEYIQCTKCTRKVRIFGTIFNTGHVQ